MTNPQIYTTCGITITLWNKYSKKICLCRRTNPQQLGNCQICAEINLLEYLTFLKENNQVRQTKMKIHLQAEKIPNKYMSHSAFIFQLDKLPNTGLSLKYGRWQP